jgi:monoterpene epsilon-lactone hydrolase
LIGTALARATILASEGQPHAHDLRDATAPETKATFREISGFFDKHMAR